MQEALNQARLAWQKDEVPIGAIIVQNQQIIAKAYNKTRTSHSAINHAEIIAINEASKILQNERLINCDLYVTKEPCAMCAGAIIHARIANLFIGARDYKFGACGTVLSVCGNERLNHLPQISFGLLENEAIELLQSFFKNKR